MFIGVQTFASFSKLCFSITCLIFLSRFVVLTSFSLSVHTMLTIKYAANCERSHQLLMLTLAARRCLDAQALHRFILFFGGCHERVIVDSGIVTPVFKSCFVNAVKLRFRFLEKAFNNYCWQPHKVWQVSLHPV